MLAIGDMCFSDLVLTITTGDIFRCLILIAASLLSGRPWFYHVDAIFSILSCTFIIINVWPSVKVSGQILLLRLPDDNSAARISKCLRTISMEGDVLDIHSHYFWQQSEDEIFGTIQVLVRQNVSERVIRKAVHSVFKNFVTNLTVEVIKAENDMCGS